MERRWKWEKMTKGKGADLHVSVEV